MDSGAEELAEISLILFPDCLVKGGKFPSQLGKWLSSSVAMPTACSRGPPK